MTEKATHVSHMTCDSLGPELASALMRPDCQCLFPTSLSETSCWWLKIDPVRIFIPWKLVSPTNQGLPTNPNPESPLLNIYSSPVSVVSNLSDTNPRRQAANVGQKVIVLKSSLELHQRMSKLDIPADSTSAITQLGVVAVVLACVCACAPVYVRTCVCMCACVFIHACACVCARTP